MYNKSEICKTANQLIKEGYTRSDAFVQAWARAKATVLKQSSIQEEKVIEVQEAMTADNTTEAALLNQVREYKELQRMIEELEAKANGIKNVIISEMEASQTEEIKVDIFKIKYITVVSNRFNTTEFKKEHSDLYNEYLKESSCKRFTVAV